MVFVESLGYWRIHSTTTERDYSAVGRSVLLERGFVFHQSLARLQPYLHHVLSLSLLIIASMCWCNASAANGLPPTKYGGLVHTECDNQYPVGRQELRGAILGTHPASVRYRVILSETLEALRSQKNDQQEVARVLAKNCTAQSSQLKEQAAPSPEAVLNTCFSGNCSYYLGQAQDAIKAYQSALSMLSESAQDETLRGAINANLKEARELASKKLSKKQISAARAKAAARFNESGQQKIGITWITPTGEFERTPSVFSK